MCSSAQRTRPSPPTRSCSAAGIPNPWTGLRSAPSIGSWRRWRRSWSWSSGTSAARSPFSPWRTPPWASVATMAGTHRRVQSHLREVNHGFALHHRWDLRHTTPAISVGRRSTGVSAVSVIVLAPGVHLLHGGLNHGHRQREMSQSPKLFAWSWSLICIVTWIRYMTKDACFDSWKKINSCDCHFIFLWALSQQLSWNRLVLTIPPYGTTVTVSMRISAGKKHERTQSRFITHICGEHWKKSDKVFFSQLRKI